VHITVTLLQIDAGIGRAPANLAQASAGVLEAGRRGSDLVLLPELWYHGLDYDEAVLHAAAIGHGAFAQMARLAREAGVYLAGSAFECDGAACYNTLAVYAPAGDLVGVYRKVHLFGPMHEDRALRPGNALVTLDLPWGKAGLAICYDLRFPELFRRHALAGAGLILLPAQWPAARLEHWRTLVQARAIENQVFVLGCNRAGADGSTDFGGHSVVCDPWGERLVEAGSQPALLTATLDLDARAAVRQRLPVWDDRRGDLY